MDADNYTEMIARIERDTAREDFRQMVSSGRRYCYYLLATGTIAIVVENYPEYFPLTYKFNLADATGFVKEANARLNITKEDVNEIVNSSMVADRRRRRQA